MRGIKFYVRYNVKITGKIVKKILEKGYIMKDINFMWVKCEISAKNRKKNL